MKSIPGSRCVPQPLCCFNQKGLLTFPKNKRFAFVDDGFSNWKKATQRFRDFLLICKEIEGLLIKSANGETVQPLPDTLLKIYFDKDVDPTQLTIQLAMVPNLIKTALNNTTKKVTNIRTIAEKSDIYINMLTEVDKLYFCIPVTSATAERSFSLLRRIKTFLRSTMCQT